MGQTTPALCTNCDEKHGFVLQEVPGEKKAVEKANKARLDALDRWKAAGYVGDLDDYLQTANA